MIETSNRKMPSLGEMLRIRKIVRSLHQMLSDRPDSLPFGGTGIVMDSHPEWHFSEADLDFELWKAIRDAARKSITDVRKIINCSDYFADLLKNAEDDDLRQMVLLSVSCFRCSLSDTEIYRMIDLSAGTEIDTEPRSIYIDSFIQGFWLTAFLLITHDKLTCRSFLNISEGACNKLSELMHSWNRIHKFINMKGHKFDLACSEAVLVYKLHRSAQVREGGYHKNSTEYFNNTYKYLIALQQADGGLSPEKFAQRNDAKIGALNAKNFDSIKMDQNILALYRDGYSDADICKLLNIDNTVLSFHKRRLEKQYKFSKREETYPGELQTLDGLLVSSVSEEPFNKDRYEFILGLIGIFLAFIGFSKVQIKIILGISDSKSKRYRSKSKKFGFIDKHIEPKYSSLEWQLLEAFYVAFYSRIGGSSVMISFDLFAAHEAYLSLVRGITAFDKENRFTSYLSGIDNFIELAKAFRQGHICLEYCSICKCYYVKHYSDDKQAFEGDCPFCEFRDIYVNKWLTGGLR